METETANKHSVRKIFLLIVIIICTSFVVYYTVMSMLGPSLELAEIKKEYNPDLTSKNKKVNGIYTDSAYLSMIRERAFLQAKNIMAKTDSIYLTINLADSTMDLEISGVVVHSSKMSSFKASRILTNGNEDIISSMLSAPLTISSDIATIRKEPVMIKMAPKDTSEYKPDIIPDTSIVEPVNYILKMTNGFRIYVYQEEEEKRADRIALLKFDLNDRLQQAWKALRRVAVFKVPEYKPFIKIRLPRTDARIIYRAIPRNGQIAIYI